MEQTEQQEMVGILEVIFNAKLNIFKLKGSHNYSHSGFAFFVRTQPKKPAKDLWRNLGMGKRTLGQTVVEN